MNPSPTSSLSSPLVSPKGLRLPASGLATSSADVPPAVRIVKGVSYFYPTSDNAIGFRMPEGGYSVEVTSFVAGKAKMKGVAAYPTEAEAMAHAETLPHEWASWMVALGKVPSPAPVACPSGSWLPTPAGVAGALPASPVSPAPAVEGVPHYTPFILEGSSLIDFDDVKVADMKIGPFWKDQAAFIVTACNAHAALVARVRDLETALAEFTCESIFCSDGDDVAPKDGCDCHSCESVREALRVLSASAGV